MLAYAVTETSSGFVVVQLVTQTNRLRAECC